jgi:uncharacterized protein (TIGR02145 family)
MKTFSTLIFFCCFLSSQSQFICGTSKVVDADGNIYNTVQIGSRCWMKENMRAIHYANGQVVGVPIHTPTTAGIIICQPGNLQLSLSLIRVESVLVNTYDLAGKLVNHTILSGHKGDNVIDCSISPGGVFLVEVICGENKVTFHAIGADKSSTSVTLRDITAGPRMKSDYIVLNATSRYAFDYNNDPALGLQYGKLYTPMSALNTNQYTGIIQGICPTGWHVPTDTEWIDLEIFCGMWPSTAQNMFQFRGAIAKSLMTTGPEWSLADGTDDYGFSAKGSGYYGEELTGFTFSTLTDQCIWWTYDSNHGLMNRLFNEAEPGVYRSVTWPEYAASIRCIKDQ